MLTSSAVRGCVGVAFIIVVISWPPSNADDKSADQDPVVDIHHVSGQCDGEETSCLLNEILHIVRKQQQQLNELQRQLEHCINDKPDTRSAVRQDVDKTDETDGNVSSMWTAMKAIRRQLDGQKTDINDIRRAVNDIKGNRQKYSPPEELLIQQHYGGNTFFNKSWQEFKLGFGNTDDNYWIGNDYLHELTKDGQYGLTIDLFTVEGQWYSADYEWFLVDDESLGYRLHIGGYNGTSGDAMGGLDGAMFTTWDRDNDVDSERNCANCADNLGGFWYTNCGQALVNSADVGGSRFEWVSLDAGEESGKLLLSRLSLVYYGLTVDDEMTLSQITM